MSPKREYLPEDQDLLSEMERIGPMSTGTALADQQRNINELQLKAVLRNRKTMSDFSRSTEQYSRALIIFAVLQILAATAQLGLAAIDDNGAHRGFHIVMGLTAAALVVLTFAVFNIISRSKSD